jgi:hypothetical protein
MPSKQEERRGASLKMSWVTALAVLRFLGQIAVKAGISTGTFLHEGNTLSGMAQRKLLDSSPWPEIFALNRDVITNPNTIIPDTVIILPNQKLRIQMVRHHLAPMRDPLVVRGAMEGLVANWKMLLPGWYASIRSVVPLKKEKNLWPEPAVSEEATEANIGPWPLASLLVWSGGVMSYRTLNSAPNQGSDWGAVVAAVGILLLLAGVLVTATARWSAGEVGDLLGSLAPVLGVVTGAFVTYFFTRQATVAATSAAQTATDVAVKSTEATRAQMESQNEQLESQMQRARALHNALTTAFGMVDQSTADKMRQDPTIGTVLGPRWMWFPNGRMRTRKDCPAHSRQGNLSPYIRNDAHRMLDALGGRGEAPDGLFV